MYRISALATVIALAGVRRTGDVVLPSWDGHGGPKKSKKFKPSRVRKGKKK